jgi:hypothetical protein
MAVTLGVNECTTQELLAQSAGRLGSLVIADTAAHVGIFIELVALTAVVFNAATVGNCTGIGGLTLPAGMTIAGKFTSITLTSGTLVAYNGV